MDPKAVIESYVDDVALRLPARLRKDVGLELRELLQEELSNAAEAEGRAPDEAMALALLTRFGAPDAVAERYRPTGPTIIRAQDARIFIILAFSGVAVQWALTLLQAVILPQDGDVWLRLAHWWPTMGLGAFWWPGVMVSAAIVAAYVRERFPRAEGEPAAADSLPALSRDVWSNKPVIDPDRVNRPFWAVILGFFAIGLVFVAATPALIQSLPEPTRGAFELAPGFVRSVGPWLLALWACQFAVFVWVLVDGRWRRPTRQLDLALKALGAVLVLWVLFGGPMLATPEVDRFAKIILGAISLVVVIDIAVKLRREQLRIGAAAKPKDAKT